ncbi:ankyrin, partial [Polyplosphaeria fusca]
LGDDLWQACTEGQIDAMTSIILQRQSTDAAYDPPFSGMLHAATLRDRANIVSYCLERGATVNDSILQALAGASSFQTHKVLIQTNTIDINYYIPWWGPVLAVVAPDEDYEWVKFCLENGANANFNRVDEYKTVLGAAAENGRMDVVQLLLDHGATVQGSGAIVLAAEAGNKEVVALLLERGADVNEVGVADPTDPRVGEDMGSALHKAVAASHEDV